MGAFDDDIQTAKELIDENGEDAIVRRITPGASPAPGRPGVPGVVDVPCRAVFLNYNLQSSGEPYNSGSLIKSGDKKVLLAAAEVADITASDSIVREDGTIYKVVNPKLLDPAGQKILWTVQVRQ